MEALCRNIKGCCFNGLAYDFISSAKIQCIAWVDYVQVNEWKTELNWRSASSFCTVDLPLIDSLIRVLENVEHCQKKPENSTESNTEETQKPDLTQDDFHLKILKDISCEFLSNILQALTKVGKKYWRFL